MSSNLIDSGFAGPVENEGRSQRDEPCIKREDCDCEGNQSNSDEDEDGGASTSVEAKDNREDVEVAVELVGNNTEDELLNGRYGVSVVVFRGNWFKCENILSSAGKTFDFHKPEFSANKVGEAATDRWQEGD